MIGSGEASFVQEEWREPRKSTSRGTMVGCRRTSSHCERKGPHPTSTRSTPTRAWVLLAPLIFLVMGCEDGGRIGTSHPWPTPEPAIAPPPVATPTPPCSDTGFQHPGWLLPEWATFTGSYAHSSKDGLLVIDGTSRKHYQHLVESAKQIFGNVLPPLDENAPTYPRGQPGREGLLGELLLWDMTILLGPERFLAFYRELGQIGQRTYISEQVFRSTAMKQAPPELQPLLDAYLQARFHC